ncbi:polyprenol reductase [Thalassophryne amazonica]|uniref:polyprenol reductase n=1 Tax=Thalassophryne amazonica TaxID=390379 RepID=UPI0014723BBE|nr:polyprenol reductase [Thalassophryne amazonica]
MYLSGFKTNYVNIFWSSLSLSFLLAFFAHKVLVNLPRKFETCFIFVLFQDLIRYGKTKQNFKRADWLRVFDVPKRWFWHFYVVSVGWNGFLLISYLNFIFLSQSLPLWLTTTLDRFTGVPSSDSQGPQLSVVLVLLLLWTHSLRRLLECLFISVFSDGSIHVVQYVFGLGYYIIVGLTVLCHDRLGKGIDTVLSQLNWFHVSGCALFIWGSLLQHQSLVLLARLRTGTSGTVKMLAHRMPKEGWFELVSCPHYFAELVIYASLGLVIGGFSVTWWLVVSYVFFNQALAAQLCHDFYISKYELYPKHRKAFIPFML